MCLSLGAGQGEHSGRPSEYNQGGIARVTSAPGDIMNTPQELCGEEAPPPQRVADFADRVDSIQWFDDVPAPLPPRPAPEDEAEPAE